MKSKICLIIFTTLLAACSHTNTIKDFASEEEYFAKINKLCEGETVLIQFVDSTTTKGDSLFIESKKTRWINENNVEIIRSTNDILSISYRLNSEGFINGILIGGGVGWLLGGTTQGEFGGLDNLLFSTIGVILGALYGGINGVEETFYLIE